VNNRQVKILIGKELVINKWKHIQVGDIIRLSADDFVPVEHFVSSLFIDRLIYSMFEG
jgi:magnesium-transporting ATPase (P-type)